VNYDWRRDPSEAISTVYSTVKSTYQTTGAKVQIIAHSMGGLITLASLNTYSDLASMVSGVVYASSPFGANPWNEWALAFGMPLLNDDQTLNKETMFTWAVSYCMFPLKASEIAGTGKGFINKVTNQQIPIDMYNVTNWTTYKLGLLHSRSLSSAEMTHLTNTLAVCKAFRSKLVVAANFKHPPCAVVASASTLTYKAALVSADLSDQSETSVVLDWGDDLFLYNDAFPPTPIVCKVFNSTGTHQAILNDQVTLALATCAAGGNCFGNGVASVTLSLLTILALMLGLIVHM